MKRLIESDVARGRMTNEKPGDMHSSVSTARNKNSSAPPHNQL